MMDVEDLLAAASENLSVRRAFGTAYEKDGMLIIPVALVAGGGGGGTGTARSRRDNSAASPGARPGGWVPAVDVTIVVVASLSLVRLLARTWTRRSRRHGRR